MTFSMTRVVSRKVARHLTPLLNKEGQGEVLFRSKNPPRSPLGKGGGKATNLLGNGTKELFRGVGNGLTARVSCRSSIGAGARWLCVLPAIATWLVVAAAASGQESGSPSPAEINPLGVKEQIVRDSFQRFEERVFRLPEQLV